MARIRRKKERQRNMSKNEEQQQTAAQEETTPEAEAQMTEGNETQEAPQEENPLQAKLEQAEAKTAEYLAMAQRVQADFENFRKRNESVRADAYADGRKDVAAMMLPVLDNLERAVEAAAGSQDEAMKSGMELVLKQMQDAYGKLDVTPINRLGEKFDPNLENAILQGVPEDGEPGTVCQVLQKGYKIGEKVLRHAMVKVVPE
ncbi:MAG: nucleotide exchange factor GrpE [Clostridia bacterium]|nr:nucleotide exchange factor GrpE [Clostridia bacterium]